MIVHDEIATIDNLADMLFEIGGVKIILKFTDPIDALQQIRKHDIDVVFVEMELSQMYGMQFAKELFHINKTIDVVLITKDKQFSFEDGNIQVADYLLKPITRERVQNTLKRLTKQNV